MTSSPKPRLLLSGLAAALLTVSLSACSEDVSVKSATEAVTKVKTCAELVKLSASQADDLTANANDPQKAAAALKKAASDAKAKAAQVDDAQVKAAIDDYVAQLRAVAKRAAQGKSVDPTDVRRAATALGNACGG